ncbi:MAG: peptidylprolyl isomerase, partial [Syntrophaceticus sp.]|nr:peptidylprolyl isomerase [Syntrophaceticus sp.]
MSENKNPQSEVPHKVTIATDKGQIVLEVYPDLMPITVANFDKLVQSGFYNGLKFHRVEDWVVQGGDPKGNGTGGPGWTIKLETNPQLKNLRGMVAMARAMDPDSAGSQFYILKTDASWLDGQYAVFGKVVQGMDVVDK